MSMFGTVKLPNEPFRLPNIKKKKIKTLILVALASQISQSAY